MAHRVSAEDRKFQHDFEQAVLQPSDFTHRAHIRLAYIYLCDNPLTDAKLLMQQALLNFLAANGVDPAKYRETMTQAWMMAVQHFMRTSHGQPSAAHFIAHNSQLLDFQTMLTHYTEDTLFSDRARVAFVEPDLDAIPLYHG